MSSDFSYKKIFRNIGIFGGAQCVTVLAAMIRAKAAALLIGSVGIGLNALFNTISTFITSVSGLGISSSAVRTLSDIDQESTLQAEVRRVRRWCIMTAIGGGGITLLLAPVFSRIYMNDYQHIGTFSLLSIIVFMSLIAGGEMAVLKSCRRIAYLAWATVASAIISVMVVIPFFYYWRLEGIIGGLVISSVLSAAITIVLGWHTIPSVGLWRKPASDYHHLWHRSRPMILLGLAFVGSGIMASGSELLIQSFFATSASLSMLGLYRAGFQLGVTYPGTIFTAISNDFYPRLSAANRDKDLRNLLVNRQIYSLLWIVLPLTIIFIVIVPYLVPLLFSDEFLIVIPMVRMMALALPFKAMTLPIGCLPLALGKSLHFFILELISWALFVVFVLLGYNLGGLLGAGVGVALSQWIDLPIVWLFCRKHYGYHFSLLPANLRQQ